MANGGRSDADLEKFITSEWPPSRLRALVNLIEVDGATAHEAGVELGCSREAIIGKARRMGLTFRRAPGQRGATRRVAPPPAPPAPVTPPPPRGSSEPMTILDPRYRSSRHCQWPVREDEEVVGRWFFCCAPKVAGATYCEEHALESCSAPGMAALRKRAEERAEKTRLMSAARAERKPQAVWKEFFG